ncbi:MAG: aminotransferase [Alphaproteobacteria bacterium]|nr:aminotransferase [Alphaproteobacteria bacterium]
MVGTTTKRQALVHQLANLSALEESGATTIVRGCGVRVFDAAGTSYIDAMGGSSCAALGFSDARLIAAITEQLHRLPFYHLFAQKSHAPAQALAERLAAMAPGRLRRVLFAGSGSEANDTAVKLVWAHNIARGKPGKRKIVTRQSSYHGSTILSAAVTGQPHMQTGFGLPTADVIQIPEVSFYRNGRPGESERAYGERCAAALDAAISEAGAESVAAFIVEPVMASAGCLTPPAGYFDAVAEVLAAHDVALIADEVVCGLGRLGAPFGSVRYGLDPDLMTLAKPLTAGYFPLSAVLMTEALYESLRSQGDGAGLFGHGLTYGGHPVGCAAALAALDIYEEPGFKQGLADRIVSFERRLARLTAHPLVGAVRNAGLLGALEIVCDKSARRPFDPALGVTARIGAALQARGVITRWTARTINLCPPLIISEAELDALFAALAGALDAVANEAATLRATP